MQTGTGRRRTIWFRAAALVVGMSLFALTPEPGGDGDALALGAAAKAGLVVEVVGLPKGQPARAILSGPRIKRQVRSRHITVRNARPGKYTLSLRRVRIQRSSSGVKRGARAMPSHRRVSIRLRAGKHAKLKGVYGTIINPGVRKVAAGDVVKARGPDGNPSEVVIQGHKSFKKGQILSVPPSPLLSRGVLSQVLSSNLDRNRTVVSLRAASPYEVAPAMDFKVPLNAVATARASAVSCGGVSGISPYRRIRNISFSGGWNTQRILRQDIKVGTWAFVGFDVEAGVNVSGGTGIDCAARASVSANGMAGPIPVTASIEGELTAFAGAGGRLNAGGSVHVDAGASTKGTPPLLAWVPEVRIGNPRFTFSSETFVEARAGIGLGIKAGIGNEHIASATLKLGSSLEFRASPGSCSWDGNFGQFSAAGKLLGWTIESPRSPPLWTRNLWRADCGRGGSEEPGGDSGQPTNPSPPDGGGDGSEIDFHLRLESPAEPPAGYYYSAVVSGDRPCDYVHAMSFPTEWGTNSSQLGTDPQRWALSVVMAPGDNRVAFACDDWPPPEQVSNTLSWTQGPVRETQAETAFDSSGELRVYSGASAGPDPCPALGGQAATEISISIENDRMGEGLHGTDVGPYLRVSLPDRFRDSAQVEVSTVCWYGGYIGGAVAGLWLRPVSVATQPEP